MFEKPTLATLVQRAKADMMARVPGSNALLRHTVLSALAYVQAGLAYGAYSYLDYISKQILPDTADDEHLERHASLWGITRNAAVPAEGKVVFTGTDGVEIGPGQVLQRVDGAQYVTSATGRISGGTLSLDVVAVEAGNAGDCAEGTELTQVTPLSGTETTVVVDAGGLTGGTDQETIEALRTRVLERMKTPPRGGSATDYVTWAKEVPGVTRAWCYPLELGAGTVVVRCACDNDGVIPDSQTLQAVKDHIEEVRPVTAKVTVLAPTSKPVNFTISYLYPDTEAIRAQIKAALSELIIREVSPGGELLISHIRAAISSATGEEDHILASPTADVTSQPGELLVMGEITWQ